MSDKLDRIIGVMICTEEEEDALDTLFAGISTVLDRKTANKKFMKRRLEVLSIQVDEGIKGHEAFEIYASKKEATNASD